MKPTLKLSAAAAAFVQQALRSRADIAKYLATPSWNTNQLLQAKIIDKQQAASTAKEQPPLASSELIAKLIKQSGLMPVTKGSSQEAEIIKDLEGQLVFVNHICEVDTTGIDPLIRLGDSAEGARTQFTYEDLANPITPKDAEVNWKPTELAHEKQGAFYVLKEGLRRE